LSRHYAKRTEQVLAVKVVHFWPMRAHADAFLVFAEAVTQVVAAVALFVTVEYTDVMVEHHVAGDVGALFPVRAAFGSWTCSLWRSMDRLCHASTAAFTKA
jgi:hypothetical protein